MNIYIQDRSPWSQLLRSNDYYLAALTMDTVPALSQKTRNRAYAEFYILGAHESKLSYAALCNFGPRRKRFT